MSNRQREALALMRERGVGAVVTRMGWTWSCQVRESEEAAEAVLDSLRRLEP